MGNLPKDSKVKADQIRTLDKARIVKHVGDLVHVFINTLTYNMVDKFHFMWHDDSHGGCSCQEKAHMR